jgi:hypothetical protein
LSESHTFHKKEVDESAAPGELTTIADLTAELEVDAPVPSPLDSSILNGTLPELTTEAPTPPTTSPETNLDVDNLGAESEIDKTH